jgi:hypothetical protein
MVKLLDYIPKIGEFLNREDQRFTPDDAAGIMFVDQTFVQLAQYKIAIPVSISVSATKRVVIVENEGLREPIKFITPTVTTEITLAGTAGNWRTPYPKGPGLHVPIPPIPGLGGMWGRVTHEIEKFLGPSYCFVDKLDMLAEIYGILRKAEEPVELKDIEGRLARYGIMAAVPLSFSDEPQEAQIAWTMKLVADRDENPIQLMFPEEKADEKPEEKKWGIGYGKWQWKW